MGGNGLYPINLHNVTETGQEVSVTVTNKEDDSVTVENTYELVPGESVVVGEKFKQIDKHTVEVAIIGGDLGGEQSSYEWNANKTLQIMILDDGPYFAFPATV